MERTKLTPLVVSTILALLFSSSSATWEFVEYLTFLSCLTFHSPFLTNTHNLLHTKFSPLYKPILQSSLQNLRFSSSSTPKPRYILTPSNSGQVHASVVCSRKHSLQIRVRSGGHDYEGLSSQADVPFVLVDLVNLRRIEIDLESNTAWVQSGATLGELYYEIGSKSRTLAFPAGVCATIGVGGHLSGGGKGFLTRKYGLAADNVLDAIVVNARAQVLDRESMGEDLFWAIRGGGAASFGIVVAWKIKLVPVPPKVTVFTIPVTLEQGATDLAYKWQHVAPKLPEDLYIRAFFRVGENTKGSRTIVALFTALYLGNADQLEPILNSSFPELGVSSEHLQEKRWIETVQYFAGNKRGEKLEDLKNRYWAEKGYWVAKSDFVSEPISKESLRALWEVMLKGEPGLLFWDPYGGKMESVSESETPFPHRKGNLYNIQYYSKWQKAGDGEEKAHREWINSVYNFMTPLVTKNPRGAYLNYRDLSLGSNGGDGFASFEDAKVWGESYFKGNFKRLARIKAKVDPENYFRNEQSIPPLFD
ncbi:berberine bridge enzyme-like 15 [Ananas comosus]|uniref:Berberine bridge enzyme-like 15 n=1 Tax=Ananas comosus TaxID=4615 RepID=A0A6P5GHB4_ANACO|nr:berberine bridge enzyme-like 15 [Ananas comosus]